MKNPGLLYIKLSKSQLKTLKPLFDYATQQYEAGLTGIVLAQARAEDNYPGNPGHAWAGKLQVGFLESDACKKITPVVKLQFAKTGTEQ